MRQKAFIILATLFDFAHQKCFFPLPVIYEFNQSASKIVDIQTVFYY